MKGDINKVTMQRMWIKKKKKIQESQRGIFITSVVSKAYEIVKKIQNEAIQRHVQYAGCRKEELINNG